MVNNDNMIRTHRISAHTDRYARINGSLSIFRLILDPDLMILNLDEPQSGDEKVLGRLKSPCISISTPFENRRIRFWISGSDHPLRR